MAESTAPTVAAQQHLHGLRGDLQERCGVALGVAESEAGQDEAGTFGGCRQDVQGFGVQGGQVAGLGGGVGNVEGGWQEAYTTAGTLFAQPATVLVGEAQQALAEEKGTRRGAAVRTPASAVFEVGAESGQSDGHGYAGQFTRGFGIVP
ncbi:hypothetical protein [Streptomyces sp. NPDC001404]|uniref:hypothetical protein n=1 Tax=Streptomyces sp. NPDC001404 TaxID=3364571 RepID=UPI0036C4BBFA